MTTYILSEKDALNIIAQYQATGGHITTQITDQVIMDTTGKINTISDITAGDTVYASLNSGSLSAADLITLDTVISSLPFPTGGAAFHYAVV